MSAVLEAQPVEEKPELSQVADLVVLGVKQRVEKAQPARTAPAANEHLRRALQDCVDARSKIDTEQAKIRELYEAESDLVKKDYLLYQHDLVALQLNRAADCAKARLAYLNALQTPAQWKAEEEKCAADILHWFAQWAWTLDPREDSPLSTIPFLPFPFQEDAIKWLDATVFERREDGAIEKSRDQGVTWITTAWSTYHWKYRAFFQVLFGSKNEDAVDSIKEPDTILEKVRFQIRLLPEQMRPKGFDPKRDMGWMKIVNPANGSIISGEAPISNFARSGRYTVIVFDEHAAWPFGGYPQWTSASQSAKSKISISTPQGKQTKQAKLAHKAGFNRLTLAWDLHPWKDSRWYKGLTISMEEQEIAQEVDIDYEASQTGLVYKKWDKEYHVITWQQFASVFGVAYIPSPWKIGIWQDVGTSPDHPTATGWHTRPSANMGQVRIKVDGVTHEYNLTDTNFMYRSHTVYDMEIGDIWNEMVALMRPHKELERVVRYRQSHEAKSERLTLRRKHKAPVTGWEPGATRGIAQMRNALKIVEKDRPHPFKPWLMGRPTFYLVVADNQYDDPVDDFGMLRVQEEFKAYHFPKQTDGGPVQAQKPYPFFNDHMDEIRIAAADGFVPSTELTVPESRETQLPEASKLATIETLPPEEQGQAYATREHWLDRLRAKERAESNKKPGRFVNRHSFTGRRKL